ncbi:MAG TPA: cupin domain-containing protein [Verrucomicrobiae bacterium]|nr:cupin domain-containing protein [Verrucomicrobiae bacterium]
MKTFDHFAGSSEGGMPPGFMSRRSLMKWLVTAAASASVGGALAAVDSTPSNTTPPLPSVKPSRQAVYISPTARRHGKFAQIAFKMASEDTDGLLGSTELVLEPGTIGAVPHLHRGFDEICRVLEGTVHILVDNQVTAVPAGGWHLRPRGLVHAFWNSGPGQARCVEIYVPAGHERFMNELADLFENGPPARDAVLALATHNDIEFHLELLDDLMKRYNVKL